MSTQDVIKKTVYEMFAGGSDMQPGRIIFLLAASAVIGLYIFAVYKNQSKSAFYSKDLNVTIAGLPIIVCGMLLAMQGSLVVSLGMVGALSIVRFRNAVKSPLDLLYFFWSISIGIMCGVGLVVLALFVSVIMTALVVLLSIVSLILIAVGSFRDHRKGLGFLSLAALACMFFGAAGSMNLPKEIFGIVERFSTYSAVVFTGILGVYWYRAKTH